MIKVIFLMSRKEEMSLMNFKEWLVNEHVDYARKLPNLKKYTANLLIEGNSDGLYDAVTELYFEDKIAIEVAFDSEVGEAAGKNVAENCSDTSRMICEEKLLI